MMSAERFVALWGSLSPIGKAGDDGGYLRHSWTDTDLVCREWFVEEALDRDLEVEHHPQTLLYHHPLCPLL